MAGAACISRTSRRCAPHSDTAPCATASATASASAKWPSSGNMLSAPFAFRGGGAERVPRRGGRRRAGGRIPVAGFLQRLDDFLRHVGLVVLGKHLVGAEGSVRLDPAERHNALPLAEQVRKNAGISDLDSRLAVTHTEPRERMAMIGAALHRPRLDQTTEAEHLRA